MDGEEKPSQQFVPLTIKLSAAVIHLTRGMRAIVDTSDWDRLTAMGKWHAHRGGPHLDVFYARIKLRGGRRVFMHSEILPCQAGVSPDHVNRNRLDNRRSNLRVATRAQNMVNKRTRNSTGFRGVRRQRSGGYQVIIRNVAFGTFSTPEEAGRAFDAEAKKQYGEFAVLNFPE